ncbi:MAG: cell envelope integrity protein CreD [Thiofilum sp.]|uniref:cell envelope integrity protein CreD n=1 Tax=Thiofilum sp. TaxID=2212733 RepID=UPI0025CEFA38|nr:cell envelope integrity protein CreD [Thiofilum sp.]MBK8452873.1 cell envelope integrity protein CreD [Thiofilum sp.]
MKNYRFAIKLLLIGFIMFLLFIPQAMLMGLISERAGWRQSAYDSIQQSWPGAQTIAGPILSIPYQITRLVKETIKDKDGAEREISKRVVESDVLRIIPKTLQVASTLNSELRYRGIYEVPVYSNQLQLSGAFSFEALQELAQLYKDNELKLGISEIAILVSDQRGINAPSAFTWGGNTYAFKPSNNLPGSSAGMHAKLNSLDLQALPSSIPFSLQLELRGMASMNYALLAEASEVKLHANWPHPKFTGELLPETRTITEQGFEAQWKATSFSYNVTQSLNDCAQGQCSSLLNRAVGFDLLQPVDVYQQAERSVKYAVLFIILTFVALVLFELLKQLRIHPIQYILVGLALIMFYLLLISLSEHFDFLRAYVVAALASVGLLTVYFGAILKSTRLGLILGASLALLYAVLYGILQAEDNALLLGSLLLFVMLAVLMLSTRHFDWYALAASMADTKTSEIIKPLPSVEKHDV